MAGSVPAELARLYLDGTQRMLCEPPEGEAEAVWNATRETLLEVVHEDDLKRYDAEFYWRFVQGSMFESTQEKRTKLAVERLRKTLRWRSENDVDEVLGASFPHLDVFRETLWPVRLLGTDGDGHAVILLRLRDCDWRKAAKTFSSKTEILRYMTFMQEFHMERLKAMRVSSRQVWIYDVGGLSMSDYRLAYSNGLSALFGLWASHYPESIQTLYVLNAPWIFRTIFGLLKSIIEPDTLEKVRISSDPPAKVASILADAGVATALLPESMCGQGLGGYLLPDAVVTAKVEDGEASAGLCREEVMQIHYNDLEALGFEIPVEPKVRATSTIFDEEIDTMAGLDPDLASFHESVGSPGHSSDMDIVATVAQRLAAARDFLVSSLEHFLAAFREESGEDHPGENTSESDGAEPTQARRRSLAKRLSQRLSAARRRRSSRLSQQQQPVAEDAVASAASMGV
ncbi:Phosphatidylinositol/phosphatidylcholine transfer protein SFH14 [Hondaea fermentalgiana]|uniref:Phosphatidylinositol/phosphatidylcholine transfer protein SFH14 n=1 Tax=Hondaea fermentalgiana TaxID=2315210 RepID=A0A2R5G711_9STRA|nr:Phosphatidylinositol/phosphatidylcholine transfer protein SFH14 [Hondaea fermentalgiana]|eukprot:GBG24243.1 Phosphatidylinositol/phosphatidylcholine transfer protein SFH14 [Hondaea fermentalgiana]